MATDKVDPIHQFHLNDLIHVDIGGLDLSFTNSSLFMVIVAVVTAGFLYLTKIGRAPGGPGVRRALVRASLDTRARRSPRPRSP